MINAKYDKVKDNRDMIKRLSSIVFIVFVQLSFASDQEEFMRICLDPNENEMSAQ
jgi:hypothetical protein